MIKDGKRTYPSVNELYKLWTEKGHQISINGLYETVRKMNGNHNELERSRLKKQKETLNESKKMLKCVTRSKVTFLNQH